MKKKLTIVLPEEILDYYLKAAKRKGMTLNMYCASMLCEFAQVEED